MKDGKYQERHRKYKEMPNGISRTEKNASNWKKKLPNGLNNRIDYRAVWESSNEVIIRVVTKQ